MSQGHNALRPFVLALTFLRAITCATTVRSAEFVTFHLNHAWYSPARGHGFPATTFTAFPAIERILAAVCAHVTERTPSNLFALNAL